MKRSSLSCIPVILAALLIFVVGCSNKGTDSGEGTSNTVTFTLTAPVQDTVNDNAVQVVFYDTWGDSMPMATGEGVFANGTAEVELSDIPAGNYLMIAAIDADGDGFSAEAPVEPGEWLWGALNVTVSSDKSITVGQYAWQEMRENSFILALEGIPAGNDGEVVAAGLFADGYNPLTSGGTGEALRGGMAIVYSNSALLCLNGDSEQDLEDGDYDIWTVVDKDGQPTDWIEDELPTNPFSDGDLVEQLDLTYAESMPDGNTLLTDCNFDTYQATTVTYTMTFAPSANMNGRGVLVELYNSFEDEMPVYETTVEVADNAAIAEIDMLLTGTFQMMVVGDKTGNGFEGDAPLDSGDVVWAALDVDVSADLGITIPATHWQVFEGDMFLFRDLPAGNNGEVMAVNWYSDSSSILNSHDQILKQGYGVIYGNSAVICVHKLVDWEMNEGSYELWCLVDKDGALADYEDPNYRPASVGDLCYDYEYAYAPDPMFNDNIVFPEVDLAPLIGISGDVTCPDYTSGDIYLYLFRENPLAGDEVESVAEVVVSAPGPYEIPFFANDSIFVLGFWDADNSGEDGGPSAGDLLGGYDIPVNSGTFDDLEYIHSTGLSTAGKDFELWMPFTAPPSAKR